ncbi:hypothetical protein [Chamaesiphon sp. OTE_8_metabat_110]|uniref:hypothetical protein n=1 Tax=Chamaesiphon sp. OTE_8_metabat_110 TaxID=2964696 RepID=UPI00286B124C|nr:hypothetical protein [Chamaesiphon sp. OTE_8_metabat_110]
MYLEYQVQQKLYSTRSPVSSLDRGSLTDRATLLPFDRLVSISQLTAHSNSTMPKFSIFILIGIGTIAATFFVPQFPGAARARKLKACVDPLPIAKRVSLTLKADKKEIENNRTVFRPIAEKATVKPGDIIKYTVVAKNNSRCPLKNLILKQPIPRGTNYVKDSARSLEGAELLFSIDGGKTFVAQPKIGTQPAPTTAYNYLRWRFSGLMMTNAQVQTTYKLQVK